MHPERVREHRRMIECDTKTLDRVTAEACEEARAAKSPRVPNFKVSSVKSFHTSHFHRVFHARDMSRDSNPSLLVIES
jgi:hypothetical protein